MKKIATTLSLLLFTVTIFSQAFEPPTTVEEFNYMNKGYEFQVSNGLDMKSGYSLQKLKTFEKGDYKFDFVALVRLEYKELAGILIIYKSKSSNRVNAFGMPVNNEILLKDFDTTAASVDRITSGAFVQAMSQFSAETMFTYYRLLYTKKEQ